MEVLIDPGNRQVEDDAGHHIEIGATDLTNFLQGESDHRVLVEDEIALGIHRVRHVPGMDAQQPFTFAGEADLQQFGIVEMRCASEPLNECIASGNVSQDGYGSPRDA
jgi:hypothetical protein